MRNTNNILVIDDEDGIRNILQDILSHKGYAVKTVSKGEEGLKILDSENVDLVLLDLVMPGLSGFDVLKTIHRRNPALPILIISAHGDIQTAVKTTRMGAIDFIEKPVDADILLKRIEENLKAYEIRRDHEYKLYDTFQRYGMIGLSQSMLEVYDLIEKCAKTNVRVLITGETGTGKELVARSIHCLSSKKDNPLIKVNCAAIPSELIESELFGYKKGAFTGALTNKMGKFQASHGGTLLLDEIGDMPLNMQAKVLRVLEDGEIQPIGTSESVMVDVRVLFSTNRSLEDEISSGRFREDLYYRINVFTIHLPSLRERKEDIPDLIGYFINMFCEEYNMRMKTITTDAIELLIRENWRGNVRELSNLVEKMVVFVEDDVIESYHVSASQGHKNVENTLKSNISLSEARKMFEKEFLTSKLIANNWNIPKTAENLHIARTDLYRRIRNLKIKNIKMLNSEI